MRLFDFLFPPRVDERILRGVSDDGFLALLAPRVVPQTRPPTVGLLPFSNPQVRAAIHEAKYHGSERAFALLALALAEYLRGEGGLNTPVLVPVPLGTRRRKERGFNQVEEVALRVARELGIALDANLLERTRETASQVALQRREREENMRGAFRATRPANPAHLYMVIDDVLTTGATLQAAVDALRDAGAVHIAPIAFAY